MMDFAILCPVWQLGAGRDSPMQSLNDALSEPLKQFVDDQIAQRRYSDMTDYVCDLIRADEERLAEEQRAALAHDDDAPVVLGDWRAIRQNAVAQAKKRAPAVPD